MIAMRSACGQETIAVGRGVLKVGRQIGAVAYGDYIGNICMWCNMAGSATGIGNGERSGKGVVLRLERRQ